MFIVFSEGRVCNLWTSLQLRLIHIAIFSNIHSSRNTKKNSRRLSKTYVWPRSLFVLNSAVLNKWRQKNRECFALLSASGDQFSRSYKLNCYAWNDPTKHFKCQRWFLLFERKLEDYMCFRYVHMMILDKTFKHWVNLQIINNQIRVFVIIFFFY